MNIEQLERIIDRYLEGLATTEEKKFIAKWLEAAPGDIQSLEEPNKQAIKTALWQSIASKSGVEKPPRRTWLQYAAAVVILVIGSFMLYTGLQKNTSSSPQLITASPGMHKKFMLPDSSTVYLFPGATLTIPDNYNQTERNIALTGRGFFEVKPNASRPFYVQAGQLRTLVLGTSFEVMITDSIHSSIIVRTGKVGIQYDNKHLADLTAGKRLRYNAQQNDFTIDEVNAAMLCEWWNNGMVFNQAPLQQVVQTLANWYNVSIEITNKKWEQEPVTIRIKDQSLPEAMALLSQTLGFRFKQEGDKIFIY